MELIKFESPELKLIEKSKADQIKQTFLPMSEMLAGFEKAYNELIKEAEKGIDLKITEKAKRLRLDIGQVRIDTGKLKDKQKENIKLEDRAIMGVHNILVWAVKEKEDKLKEIEKHFEILEQKRLDELQKQRVGELSKYVDDAEERRLSEMDEDVWNAYLNAKKQAWEDEQEAIKKAEAERIENERVQKLYFEREKELRKYDEFTSNIIDLNDNDLGKKTDDEYLEIKNKLIEAKENHDKAIQLHKDRKEMLIEFWNFVPIENRDDDFSKLTDNEFKKRYEHSKNLKIKDDKEKEKQRLENERLKKEQEKAKAEADKLKAEKDQRFEERKKLLISMGFDYSESREYNFSLKDTWSCFWEQVYNPSDKEFNETVKAIKEAIDRKEKNEKLEAELKAKKDAEIKAENERKAKEEKEKEAEQARIQSELNKGDSDKVNDLVNDLNSLKSKYSFKSKKNQKMYANVSTLLDKIINHIENGTQQ